MLLTTLSHGWASLKLQLEENLLKTRFLLTNLGSENTKVNRFNSETNNRSVNLSIITQFYPPDFAATGQFVEEMALNFTQQGMRVKLFTGQPSYAFDVEDAPTIEENHGVHIYRSSLLRTRSRRMLKRTISSLAFCCHAFVHYLKHQKQTDILMLVSEPPYLQTIGYILNRLTGISYACLVYDLYPEVAVALDLLPQNHWVIRLWDWINRRVWARAESIIVPCSTMKDRIVSKNPKLASKITVIHNWSDPTWIKPLAKPDNPFAQQNNLVDTFTVLYSGNMGRCHDIETIINAATILKDDPVQFLFIGGGPKRDDCAQQIENLGLTNCRFLPYQDKHLLPQSLTACDLSLVSIDMGMEGLVAPSKFYSALSSGRPVAVICEKHSYLRSMVAEAGCGVAISNGDSQGLADFIRYLVENPKVTKNLGLSGHQYIQGTYTSGLITRQYSRLLYDAVIQHTDLREAVEELATNSRSSQFCIYYQPVVSLDNHQVVSVEALLRWNHPQRGTLNSDSFIVAAEVAGVILPLGWWMIEQALIQLAEWHRKFPMQSPMRLSINLSSQQFFAPDLATKLEALLQKYQLSGNLLILEIQDQVAMEDPAATTAIFLQLRARKIQLCIDGFGASHSSLAYLHRFPVDILKTDASLVQRLSIDPDNINLLETIGILAQHLRMTTIATGVENQDQANHLQKVGYTYGQGFFFSPVLPHQKLTELFQTTSSCEPSPKSLITSDLPSGPVILLIDNDRFMRTLLTTFMHTEGYQIIEVSTGKEGIEAFRRHQPDLVMLDVNMTDMDGLDCCQQLRKLSKLLPSSLSSNRQIAVSDSIIPPPIIVATVLNNQVTEENIFAAGATDYLPKPINYMFLRRYLRRHLTDTMRRRLHNFLYSSSRIRGKAKI